MIKKNKFIVGVDNIDTVAREQVCFQASIPSISDLFILPGLTDVHVHLREPGFLYKETMRSGTMAAVAGGFTDIFSMPNLNPCPDSLENLEVQMQAIRDNALANVYPYGAISIGEKGKKLADLSQLAEHVIAFTDDGFGLSSEELMREAMLQAKALNKIIVAHCEDESYPKESSEAEWKQLERDLRLAAETGCKYHVCHISTKESVELIRKAKRDGLDVSCETAAHYLTICREEVMDYIDKYESGDVQELSSGRFKMNPPIKLRSDREALIEAVADGTIDMIASDHAPHSAEEKARGFADSAYGIVGLETSFPVCYTELVLKGHISLERLVELMYVNPRQRFGLEVVELPEMLERERATYAVWDLHEEYQIQSEDFLSKGKSSPFEGWIVKGRCIKTVINGETVYERKE